MFSTALTAAGLVLLFASTAEAGVVAVLARFLWLAVLAAVCVTDLGAAFGLSIVSIVLFNAYHVLGPATLADRFDNFGIGVLVLFAALRIRPARVRDLSRPAALIAAFMALALVQAGLAGGLDWYAFAQFVRMFGLPFLLWILASAAAPSREEIRSFVLVMMALGVYLGIVSVLEQADLYAWILPPWIGDASVNPTIGTGRSGGPLLQSEFNGFALGLIYALAFLLLDGKDKLLGAGRILVPVLCVIGIYFTYTRAAWLAVLLASAGFFISVSAAKRSWKVLASASLSALLFAALIVSPGQFARERAGDTGTIHYRFNLWAAGLTMAVHKPLLGHGLGRFQAEATDYRTDPGMVPEVFIPESGAGAHNVFINIQVEQGLAGLLIYLLIVRAVIVRGLRAASGLSPGSGRAWVVAFTGVYFINAQFVNVHEPSTNLIYFAAMGLIAGLGPGPGSVGRASSGRGVRP